MTLEVKVNHLRTELYSDVHKFNILGSVFLSARNIKAMLANGETLWSLFKGLYSLSK